MNWDAILLKTYGYRANEKKRIVFAKKNKDKTNAELAAPN